MSQEKEQRVARPSVEINADKTQGMFSITVRGCPTDVPEEISAGIAIFTTYVALQDHVNRLMGNDSETPLCSVIEVLAERLGVGDMVKVTLDSAHVH